MYSLLQNQPIVVEVVEQPAAAPDITIQVVLGMFQFAGVVLLIAAAGGLLVGGLFVLYRRMREGSAAPEPADAGHVTLKL